MNGGRMLVWNPTHSPAMQAALRDEFFASLKRATEPAATNEDIVDVLRAARASIQTNRDALYDCHYDPDTGSVDALGAAAIHAEDILLARIDAAIAKATTGDAA